MILEKQPRPVHCCAQGSSIENIVERVSKGQEILSFLRPDFAFLLFPSGDGRRGSVIT